MITVVKGQALLLRAMRHVVTAWPQARLRIAGDGPLRGALQHQIAALANYVRAHFTDKAAWGDLPNAIDAARQQNAFRTPQPQQSALNGR